MKCTTCFYCDRECQTKNWKKMHKRVCSEDPSIKPHVPIEMAVERVLKRLPSQETAPADATCYICLDHDSKLVRGCACRGESSGFVHLECLIEYAERNGEGSLNGSFCNCVNCNQSLTGALQLELARRWWRRHRNESAESRLLVESCNWLGETLGRNDEEDAGNRLFDALSNSPHFARGRIKLKAAQRLAKERPEEGLKLLEEVVSQAKQDGDTELKFLAQRQYMQETLDLERYEETLAVSAECLESVKTSCGDSSDPVWIGRKHKILDMHACACGMTGRFDESKRDFDELFALASRIYGCEHENTRDFLGNRSLLLQKMAMKAQDLVLRGDLANGAKYLDAVLAQSTARDFFDANDPNVELNCETLMEAAFGLLDSGREQESLAVARMCLTSARERKDLDSSQKCMWNYARISFELHGPTKESKVVLDELLAIQARLYGPDAPQTQETASLIFSLHH